MITKNTSASILAAAVLAGCAYEPLIWTHRTSGATDYERDSAQCRNEATYGAANYNALVTYCMRVRGWYQVQSNPLHSDQTVPVPLARAPRVRSAHTLPPPVTGEPSAPDLAAPPLARDKAGGRWSYAAERATAFYFASCEMPRAYLTSSIGVRTEFFEVVCASGRSLEMQCDHAECAPS